MIKKILFASALLTTLTTQAVAGGLMTNTNYHIAFDRMMARGASFDIDAAYSNPAGLAWGHEGLQLSLNFQKPWQNRDIKFGQQTYEGKASAPIVPALFGSYRHDRWALSAMIGIVGSGGFVEYKQGVPSFNVAVASMLGAMNITPDQYQLSSQMKGKQYIFGGQLNFTYRLLDCLSAAVGVRANYYDGYYQGYVIADKHPMFGDLAKLQLDVDQRGWGVAPLVSVDFHQGPLTVAARYEFRTKLNIPNTVNQLEAGLGDNLQTYIGTANPAALQQIAAALDAKTKPYQEGVKTRYDMPALLSLAVGYEITPKLRATAEYHFFDDKNAQMADDRQKQLERGTHEFLLGAEYDINDRWTVSLGGQRTDYGLADGYQQDTSFACDSYSVGAGVAVNLTEKMRLNAGYFCSIYSDYTKQAEFGTETFSRTNHVIGLGLDYKF